MFAISTKAKVAAGVTAAALMLGAAGAWVASANNTFPVTITNVNTTALPSGPTLLAVNPKATPLTLPPSFANHGACISFFATNRDFALVSPSPSVNTTVNISKNFHGKLVSGLQSWCDAQVKASSTTSTDQTATTDTTQSNDTQSGPPQGHGHGHGHGKPAAATD
jgi:hypothetical protein